MGIGILDNTEKQLSSWRRSRVPILIPARSCTVVWFLSTTSAAAPADDTMTYTHQFVWTFGSAQADWQPDRCRYRAVDSINLPVPKE
jgi:hypothetical protein